MRANRVKVGARVKVIAGEFAGLFGAITDVAVDGKRNIIAVKIDGQNHSRHYGSNDLHLVHKLDNSR